VSDAKRPIEVMVRYRVKPERVADNEAAVRAVYDELARAGLGGVRYATFKLADGLTFVHVARVDAEGGRNPLVALESFRRFQAGLGDRCDEPPVSSTFELIGAHGFFA